jgi:hypothetical protein
MAMNSVREERRARKVYVHERQVMVIRTAITFLVVCAVIAILGLAGLFRPVDPTQTVSQANNFGVTAPCPPANATYPNVSQTSIRILNGTTKSGLATAVGQALQNRGFRLQGVSNSTEKLGRTEIRTGAAGLPEAYLVLAQFNDASLRLDDRTDQLVDVIIGNSFSNLDKTKRAEKTAGTKITGLQGCVAANKITALPKAPAHTPVTIRPNDSGQTS